MAALASPIKPAPKPMLKYAPPAVATERTRKLRRDSLSSVTLDIFSTSACDFGSAHDGADDA